MAKPICFTTIPDLDEHSHVEIQKDLESRLPDYHVLVARGPKTFDGTGEIKMQVFHEKDFTEIQYEELKKIITDSIQSKP